MWGLCMQEFPLTCPLLPEAATPEGGPQLERLIVAMACVECGLRPDHVARDPIREGYRLAFGRKLRGKGCA